MYRQNGHSIRCLLVVKFEPFALQVGPWDNLGTVDTVLSIKIQGILIGVFASEKEL